MDDVAPSPKPGTMSNMKKRYAIAFSVCAALSGQSMASELDFREPEPGKMLKGEFIQVSKDGQRSTGKFWLASNNRARWSQSTPYAMLVVSSGSSAWQVEPDLNQAALHHIPDGGLFTAIQQGSLKRNASSADMFSGTLEGVGKVNVQMPHGALMPSRVEQLEQGTTTTFFSVEKVKLDPTVFEYAPPKGMDVIQ